MRSQCERKRLRSIFRRPRWGQHFREGAFPGAQSIRCSHEWEAGMEGKGQGEGTVRQGMDTHTEVTQRCFRGCRAMIQGHREGVPNHSSETSLLLGYQEALGSSW